MLLSIDGAWRAGFTPAQITDALIEKRAINFEREWVVADESTPNEHKRLPTP